MARAPVEAGIGAQGARFLAVGALNTAATYGIYCVLVAFIAPQAAYAMVFALGVGAAYVLNSRFVFGATMHVRSATLYPLVYVLQYAANALLIDAFIGTGLGARAALALALVVVTPLSFLLNRLVLSRRRASRAP